VRGAEKRLRPKFKTVATMFVGLIPIMWSTGTGSDEWKRIAVARSARDIYGLYSLATRRRRSASVRS